MSAIADTIESFDVLLERYVEVSNENKRLLVLLSKSHGIKPEFADKRENIRFKAALAAKDEDLARLREALEPFATDWADENGWTDTACQKDRIVDWFGPSDFLRVRAALTGKADGTS